MKKISLPVSKSLYIRKLICNFLYNGFVGEIPSDSPEDIRVVHQSLTHVFKVQSDEVEVAETQWIDVRDCGAAYRFLMAVLAVIPGSWLLTGTPRLLQRPIKELVDALRSIGADIQYCSCRDALQHVSTKSMPSGWLIHGKPLHASELIIDCTRSGQFASALWLISGKIGLQKLHILPENPPSLSYIEMTKAVVNESVKLEDGHLADWSAAVYWYARLLLEGQMQSSNRPLPSSDTALGEALSSYKLQYLDLSSIQSDAVIARWFANWGIESRQAEDGVVISHNEHLNKPQNMMELDMSQNLDLVPVLACMACLWPQKMVFNGVANLKYKESNRLQIIQEQLSAFAKISVNTYNGVDDNQLVINPCRDVLQRVSTKNDGVNSGRDAMHCVSTNCSNGNNANCPDADFIFDAHNDHRFVMGFSLFALYGKVQIKGFDCVRKSYPNFKAEGVVAGTDIVG